MDFLDTINDLAARKAKQIDLVDTEEATKNALVMPFIAALGYNVFNPSEVMPEFTADVGTKRGEKADYAILKDGTPIMLFECKRKGTNLDEEHASQLYRYFSVTDARFGVLTNGIIYRFYSDLEQPNRMDSKPFLEFNLLEVDEGVVEELKKFAKDEFDADTILTTAKDLKYSREIKRILGEQLVSPSADFVKLFVANVYSGRMKKGVMERFQEITKDAFHSFINDRVGDTLKSAQSALKKELEPEPKPVPGSVSSDNDEGEDQFGEPKIVTTDEEQESFYIVKAILHDVVNTKRVAIRDHAGFCAILLDDSNRRPICRLYFNNPERKRLGLLDEQKKEERIPIEDVDDIYNYADRLKTTVGYYQ